MLAALVSLYLMFYLTEVLDISGPQLAAVTVILVVMRVFDAVNDGWALGFGVASAFLLGAAVVAASLVRVSKEEAAKALATWEVDHA